jgi:hypothetical protein
MESITSETLHIDTDADVARIKDFIVASSDRDGVVVLISGGLDSSVIAALCVDALVVTFRYRNVSTNADTGKMPILHLIKTTSLCSIYYHAFWNYWAFLPETANQCLIQAELATFAE